MRLRYTVLPLLLSVVAGMAQAQHLDVLLQIVDGKIVTGEANYDNNTWLVGQRVYRRQFLSNFRTNDPGYTSLESDNPLLESGVSGFAPNDDVFVDIVLSTIDGRRANFWYWDGLDPLGDGFSVEDVSFDLAPPGVTWNLFGDGFQLFTADGSDTVVPGALIQTAFSDGGVHSHLLMQIADSDGDSQTLPPEGIYLASLVARADGYEQSDPFFFVHRTAGLTNEPRDVAAEWVRTNYDMLVEEPLPGDFTGDGIVDGADFLHWQRTDGAPESLAIWESSFVAGTPNTSAIPEPSSLALTVLATAALLTSQCRRLNTPR